jgi:RNA polymerase sigma-70 factor, ECF subfamily
MVVVRFGRTSPRGTPSVSEPTDDELMGRVRDGDTASLAVLFERWQGPLYNFFLRLTGRTATSEDLVQESFLRILRSKHTYRPEGRFKAWIYQVARSAHADHYRKRWRERPLEDEDVQIASHAAPVTDRLESAQQSEMLRAALARLPEDKRSVLVLSRYQGLRYSEIASILGCPENTVKVRVHRAVKALREAYLELTKDPVL